MAVFAGGCTVADVEAVCANAGESVLNELESLVEKALLQIDAQSDRLRMLQTIGEYAQERLEGSQETRDIAVRHAYRYAAIGREIRDGIEGAGQIGAVERGIAEEPNLQAALDTLLAAARGGDAAACEAGMQLSGDLFFYWHIRGKNISARDYAAAFLGADAARALTLGRADHRRACVMDPRPARAVEGRAHRGLSHRS
jgi:predicted ATPase